MKIDATAVRKCLKSFDFSVLFREHLGWDKHNARLDIPVGGTIFSLTAIAQKRGFIAYLCHLIPDRATRLKIDHKVSKSVREHFVIYIDQDQGRQIWHWVRREPGKPLASRDHRFDIAQSGDPLIQRLNQIAISMDEEEDITLPDVTSRTKAAFDVDKITKKFYDRFRAEHAAFLKLIKGIKSNTDLAWYTSLMLNRLMFVYFIQKKGFLDGDTDYLRNRLTIVQKLRGKNRFQTFYRYFLLRLFHEGLGKSPDERLLDSAMEKLLGRVPFLNGGFFEVHQLEEQNPDIDIPDEAFEKLFAFFDHYRWHLDERPLRADNEINPDVVGYIFEKYINQKQMGAYYTKEDITEYISKNTLIPFLFDSAEKKCPIAFKPESFLWRLLRENPDRYIYSAAKYGVIRNDGLVIPDTELPDFVQAGMLDPKARMHNKRYNLEQAPAGDSIRLVTETWREYICRRNRCIEIREKLSKGEVHQINDLITLNLDIWQFARDVIVTSEGPELLRAFWQAVEKVTILDPTCGSGAFLFAALRILETLYSDCLERMTRFIEDIENKPHHPKQFTDFKEVMAQIAKHPNDRYFILKSIIINNLFGVDIMAEAVEICKLRLFLKLVAQVETAEQIEPLPDMDFNIRTGNTLVGYATEDQARRAFTEEAAGKEKQKKLPFGETVDAYRRFEEDLLIVEKSFLQFRAQQTIHGGKVTREDKQELRSRLEKLDTALDRYLASEYRIAAGSYKAKTAYEDAFAKWKFSHQPFHWFVEFYGIMQGGGFDVIIGNPPYVEYHTIRNSYQIYRFHTEPCGNLYAYVLERCFAMSPQSGRIGMIVQLSAICTDRMRPLQDLYHNHSSQIWASCFDDRPGKLFDGLQHIRATILLSATTTDIRAEILTTNLMRWATETRTTLFPRMQFSPVTSMSMSGSFPKASDPRLFDLLTKLWQLPSRVERFYNASSKHAIYYYRSPLYWIRAMDFLPYFSSETAQRSVHHFKDYPVIASLMVPIVGCLINSTTFYIWFVAYGNGRNVTLRDISAFPVPNSLLDKKAAATLHRIFVRLMDDYRKHSKIRRRLDGVEFQEFAPGNSKPIMNEIDVALAPYFGFTDDELDFIINYDIKYRMGRDGRSEAEDHPSP